MLKPVNHNSASSQIYEQLLHYITSGEWPVGTRLPSEKDLAEQFGVSRVPIREALQRLRAIGVVRSLQGSGSFVCGNSPLEAMETILSCNRSWTCWSSERFLSHTVCIRWQKPPPISSYLNWRSTLRPWKASKIKTIFEP